MYRELKESMRIMSHHIENNNKEIQGLQDVWDMIKNTNICTVTVTEGEETDKGEKEKNIWRSSAWKLPN